MGGIPYVSYVSSQGSIDFNELSDLHFAAKCLYLSSHGSSNVDFGWAYNVPKLADASSFIIILSDQKSRQSNAFVNRSPIGETWLHPEIDDAIQAKFAAVENSIPTTKEHFWPEIAHRIQHCSPEIQRLARQRFENPQKFQSQHPYLEFRYVDAAFNHLAGLSKELRSDYKNSVIQNLKTEVKQHLWIGLTGTVRRSSVYHQLEANFQNEQARIDDQKGKFLKELMCDLHILSKVIILICDVQNRILTEQNLWGTLLVQLRDSDIPQKHPHYILVFNRANGISDQDTNQRVLLQDLQEHINLYCKPMQDKCKQYEASFWSFINDIPFSDRCNWSVGTQNEVNFKLNELQRNIERITRVIQEEQLQRIFNKIIGDICILRYIKDVYRGLPQNEDEFLNSLREELSHHREINKATLSLIELATMGADNEANEKSVSSLQRKVRPLRQQIPLFGDQIQAVLTGIRQRYSDERWRYVLRESEISPVVIAYIKQGRQHVDANFNQLRYSLFDLLKTEAVVIDIFTKICQELESKLLIREDDDHEFWVHLREHCAAPSVRIPDDSRQFLWNKTNSLDYAGQDFNELEMESAISENLVSLFSLQNDLNSANEEAWRKFVDSPRRESNLEQRKRDINAHKEKWNRRIYECNKTVLAASQQIITNNSFHSKIRNGLKYIAITKNINEVRDFIPEFTGFVEQGYKQGFLESQHWEQQIIDPSLCDATNDGVARWQVSRYLGVIALYYSPKFIEWIQFMRKNKSPRAMKSWWHEVFSIQNLILQKQDYCTQKKLKQSLKKSISGLCLNRHNNNPSEKNCAHFEWLVDVKPDVWKAPIEDYFRSLSEEFYHGNFPPRNTLTSEDGFREALISYQTPSLEQRAKPKPSQEVKEFVKLIARINPTFATYYHLLVTGQLPENPKFDLSLDPAFKELNLEIAHDNGNGLHRYFTKNALKYSIGAIGLVILLISSMLIFNYPPNFRDSIFPNPPEPTLEKRK